jgi:hypothetical protein
MAKKKWTTPVCEKVKLIPEEAVLAGCKVGGIKTSTVYGNYSCASPQSVPQCKKVGS